MTTPKLNLFAGYRSPLLFVTQLTGTGILFTALLLGCKTTPPAVVQQAPAKPVILTLGNKPFSTDDFFSIISRKISQRLIPVNRTDIREYLDLYTNLKL